MKSVCVSVYTDFLDFTPIFWMSAILGIHSQFFYTDFLDLVPFGAFFTGIPVYTDFLDCPIFEDFSIYTDFLDDPV